MWSYNLKQGAIWLIKSMNSYDEYYEGMQFGDSYVLILSTYKDINDIEKFTYLKLDKVIKNEFITYELIQTLNGKFYINFNSICTGDRRALEKYICDIRNNELNMVLNTLKVHFSIFSKIKELSKKEEVKPIVKIKPKTEFNKDLITIEKYRHTIKFKPSEHIQLNNDRFKFSKQFKEDVCKLSSKEVSTKYNIFPEQVICIIRSKLNYNKNHI